MLTLKKANIIDANDSGADNSGFSATVSGTLAGRAMVGNWGGSVLRPQQCYRGRG